MNKTLLLIGSLSNDLMRVANCKANGSQKAADRFAHEAKRWAKSLSKRDVSEYIKKIAIDVETEKSSSISLKTAEKYLMYSILLQNYSLKHLDKSS